MNGTAVVAHHGVLDVHVERGADAITRVVHAETCAPLKLAPAHHDRDGRASLVVMECSPGMLPGDSYDLRWQIGPGADVCIGTRSHLRVHGGDAPDAPPSSFRLRLHVAAGASVELRPEPVVLHAGSAWHGDTLLELEQDAVAMVSEITTAGRVAHGEQLQFRQWSSRLAVRLDGRLIAAGQQLLEPGLIGRDVATALLGGATHWASLHIVGGALDRVAWEALRERLDAALDVHEHATGAVDLLDQAGVCVLLRARSAWAVSEVLRGLVDTARDAVTAVRP